MYVIGSSYVCVAFDPWKERDALNNRKHPSILVSCLPKPSCGTAIDKEPASSDGLADVYSVSNENEYKNNQIAPPDARADFYSESN